MSFLMVQGSKINILLPLIFPKQGRSGANWDLNLLIDFRLGSRPRRKDCF